MKPDNPVHVTIRTSRICETCEGRGCHIATEAAAAKICDVCNGFGEIHQTLLWGKSEIQCCDEGKHWMIRVRHTIEDEGET